ncbi:hypothetical protein GP486_005779 [Trichoglossum hirsutum]|uniref:PNPLA domain-containing protein n=1 Tax=Trichoglossum hirsutum TaxID=265104 RepID=A0A9P8RLM3_9PEZI|nr:hypothetical protein GP486_005779 [Trichoglossum hirsutum]
MLGRLRMTVSEAIDAYLELSTKVFEPKHRWNFFANLANLSQAKGICDTDALESSIKGVIVQQLGEGKDGELLLEENRSCHIFVCAIRADMRSLIRFRNYSVEGAADLQPKIWEAARATSAATTFFDPITVGKFGQTFVDGGGGYNNPVQEAYEEALSCWENRDIECIVSIGTGQSPLKAFGNNLKQVGQTLIDIATDTDEKAALFARNHPQFDGEGAERRLFRFQVARGLESVGMVEHKKIKDIATATQVYMENSDQTGNKQLKLFKALVARTRSASPIAKASSVPLEPDKVRYIEKYAHILEFRSSQLLLANRKPDYGSGSISLPTRLLCNPEAHGVLGGGKVTLPAPIWTWVLSRYRGDAGVDTRKSRIPVQEVNWCSDFGADMAIEVPVVDVWRIIASFNPYYANYTNEPNTETEIHVHDLWISVPSTLKRLPLIHMALRPETSFAPYDKAWIPSEKFAIAMCGGKGLEPDKSCLKTVYSSRETGWDLIKIPMAFAFATIPTQNRCYFAEQWEWITKRCVHMLDVCHYLWDHAEAIDLDENQVPMKVLLEDVRGSLTFTGGEIRRTLSSSGWRLLALDNAVQPSLLSLLQPADAVSEDFVEIEDAVNLLMKSDGYSNSDKVFWDDDGTNRIVDDWVGLFGPQKARWTALHMTVKLLINACDALVFPQSFNPLLHSGTGTCFIA